MSNQPFYPAQQNPSQSPNENNLNSSNSVSNNTENSYPSSEQDYNRDYPVQTPQPSAYGHTGNNDPFYSSPQPSANSYGSPNMPSANESDPYATSGDSYGQQDPYASSAASANSWDNANQMYSQPAPQAYQQQNNQQSQTYSPQNHQQSQDLNIKALLGLIFSFFFFPAGLILSWMGFRETRNTSDNTGRVMSIIGLVVSGFQTVLFVLWVALFIFLMLLGMAGV